MMKTRLLVIALVMALFIPPMAHGGVVYYDFKLGSNTIGENTITFEFPSDMNILYLFHLTEWKGPRFDRTKLVVHLYDKNHAVICVGESVCIGKNFASFGSIAFSRVTKEKVREVAFFSIATQGC